eukprot:5341686-Amphidinium_carterae.1
MAANAHATAAACLKVADVFSEQSKEYYKQDFAVLVNKILNQVSSYACHAHVQENATEYADATLQQVHHRVLSTELVRVSYCSSLRVGLAVRPTLLLWFNKGEA